MIRTINDIHIDNAAKDEDEMCICGHHRWAHANWQMQVMVGFCHFEDENCRCEVFTSAQTAKPDETVVMVGVLSK